MVPNPLRIDPSRTGTVFRSFLADARRRFASAGESLYSMLDESSDPVYRSPDAVAWFRVRLSALIESTFFVRDWWTQYANRAYVAGISRGWDELRGIHPNHPKHYLLKSEFMNRVLTRPLSSVPSPPPSASPPPSHSPRIVTHAARPSPQGRDTGGRFISDRARLLGERLKTELRGMTDDMSQKIARELISGIEKGWTPRTIASAVRRRVEIGRGRMETIARTELVRAQAEGQLDAMEELGVTTLEALVEWETRGTHVCPLCAPMEGAVFTLEEARGMIPRHPNCRCAWAAKRSETPAQKRQAERAVRKSRRVEDNPDSDWGPATEIVSRRPTTNDELVRLAAEFESRKGEGDE